MATNYETLDLEPEQIASTFAVYCENKGCGNCAIKKLCDEAFGMNSGCFEEDWLEWLKEECDE